jgi:hypothetical protein
MFWRFDVLFGSLKKKKYFKIGIKIQAGRDHLQKIRKKFRNFIFGELSGGLEASPGA